MKIKSYLIIVLSLCLAACGKDSEYTKENPQRTLDQWEHVATKDFSPSTTFAARFNFEIEMTNVLKEVYGNQLPENSAEYFAKLRTLRDRASSNVKVFPNGMGVYTQKTNDVNLFLVDPNGNGDGVYRKGQDVNIGELEVMSNLFCDMTQNGFACYTEKEGRRSQTLSGLGLLSVIDSLPLINNYVLYAYLIERPSEVACDGNICINIFGNWAIGRVQESMLPFMRANCRVDNVTGATYCRDMNFQDMSQHTQPAAPSPQVNTESQRNARPTSSTPASQPNSAGRMSFEQVVNTYKVIPTQDQDYSVVLAKWAEFWKALNVVSDFNDYLGSNLHDTAIATRQLDQAVNNGGYQNIYFDRNSGTEVFSHMGEGLGFALADGSGSRYIPRFTGRDNTMLTAMHPVYNIFCYSEQAQIWCKQEGMEDSGYLVTGDIFDKVHYIPNYLAMRLAHQGFMECYEDLCVDTRGHQYGGNVIGLLQDNMSNFLSRECPKRRNKFVCN